MNNIYKFMHYPTFRRILTPFRGMGALATVFIAATLPALAAEEAKAPTLEKVILNSDLTFNLLFISTAIIVIISLLVCISALTVLKFSLDSRTAPSKSAEETQEVYSLSKWFNEKFVSGKLVPIGQESKIIIKDHEYDGIHELDNGMPPWLRTFFLVTIVFGVIYVGNYLVFDTGMSQLDEYNQEVAIAAEQAEKRQAQLANSVDENNVKVNTEVAHIEEGKSIYQQNCKVCHGGSGEGGVGPNLTDPFWIHGGKINDVFKTIKYGVPQKGMIAWQAKLKPVEIQKVASYILTLQGTNPPNGKAPQGEPLAVN